MSKIAFVFAGQGSQFVGMGKDIITISKRANQIFENASDILGYDMKNLVFEGPEETLMITENTQPAILTASYAMLQPLVEAGIRATVTAGLSLGEYTANVYAETLSFEEAVKTVRLRGKYMQEEVPAGVGGMSAVLGLDDETVAKACSDVSEYGYVACANFNCPGQVVVSGQLTALAKVGELLLSSGAKRVIPLSVSAPFHCELLKGAGEKLRKQLETIIFNEPKIPVIANTTGLPYDNQSVIKDLLVDQVSHTVKWTNSVNYMIKEGIDTFIEIGPGKTLSGLIKKTDKNVRVFNVQDSQSLKDTLENL
ncbi:MAG: ACP S-malonyltransferase [Clostridia bacterium]|nr:ACP S-malonyltransferase [Clostridia bacterium]